MFFSDKQHLLHLAVISSETTLRSLLIKRWQILAGLFHRFHDLVERHTMVAVGKSRVDVGVQGSGSGVGIALDAWNLDKTTHRVAGHAQVVFKRHLCGVFNLGRTSPKQLVGSSGSHGAGHAHLALTAHLGTRDGGVGAHDVPTKPAVTKARTIRWSVNS